jgi:hypothetical protein
MNSHALVRSEPSIQCVYSRPDSMRLSSLQDCARSPVSLLILFWSDRKEGSPTRGKREEMSRRQRTTTQLKEDFDDIMTSNTIHFAMVLHPHLSLSPSTCPSRSRFLCLSDTCFSPERPLISRIPVSCVVKLHPTARHYMISGQGGSGTMQSLVLDQWVVSTLMQEIEENAEQYWDTFNAA